MLSAYIHLAGQRPDRNTRRQGGENTHSCLTTPCPLQTETQAQCPSSASTFKYIFLYKKEKEAQEILRTTVTLAVTKL